MSDQELADAIKVAADELCAAIDAAFAAGLEVECRIDAKNTYSSPGKVRNLGVTVIRKIRP